MNQGNFANKNSFSVYIHIDNKSCGSEGNAFLETTLPTAERGAIETRIIVDFTSVFTPRRILMIRHTSDMHARGWDMSHAHGHSAIVLGGKMETPCLMVDQVGHRLIQCRESLVSNHGYDMLFRRSSFNENVDDKVLTQ